MHLMLAIGTQRASYDGEPQNRKNIRTAIDTYHETNTEDRNAGIPTRHGPYPIQRPSRYRLKQEI